MTYNEWRKTYEARQHRFLVENEREFGRLLTTLRRGIFIPGEVDERWEKHVHNLMKGFAEDYRRLLEKQLTAAIDFELEGRRLSSKRYEKIADEHNK